MRKIKKEIDHIDENVEELKYKKTTIAEEVAELKAQKEIPTQIDESLDNVFVSWLSYKDLRSDLSKMKKYYVDAKKAYKGNDTATLRSLVNSNKNEEEEELINSIKWHLSNIEQAYDAIEENLYDLNATILDLDATPIKFIEPDLTESESQSESDANEKYLWDFDRPIDLDPYLIKLRKPGFTESEFESD